MSQTKYPDELSLKTKKTHTKKLNSICNKGIEFDNYDEMYTINMKCLKVFLKSSKYYTVLYFYNYLDKDFVYFLTENNDQSVQ